MTNRPKAIGTAAESACVRVLRANGWPDAERRALTGALDRGDVTGVPGIVIEVKSGKAAETASDAQVIAWLEETERERARDNAAYGVLVMKKRGVGHENAAQWTAAMWSDAFTHLLTSSVMHGSDSPAGLAFPVRTTFLNILTALREAGWGTPIDEAV